MAETKQGTPIIGVTQLRKRLKAGTWAVVSGVVLTLVVGWVIALPQLLTAKKLTILVPVQGDERPADMLGDEPYEDKISNDVAHTINNAQIYYATKHPEVRYENFDFH